MKRLILFIAILLSLGYATRPFLVWTAPNSNPEIQALNKEIQEKKEKIKELEDNIEAYKKKITQKQSEGVSLSNQIALLDNRGTQVELDIQVTEKKIETVSLEVQSLAIEIQEKTKLIERQKEILSEFIRQLHYEGDKKYIEILTVYDNFSQFYNKLQYLEKIEEDMGNETKTLRLAKTDLELDKNQAEESKNVFEKLNQELQQKKQDLEEQTTAKQSLLSQTQASERTYKTLVANLKQQYKETENEISSIEQSIRKALSENEQFNNLSDSSRNLSWPTQSRYITAYFHDPDYPYRYVFEHSAIDIRSAYGTPVKAAAAGYVARAKICTSPSCYAYVMIVHSDGISTVYGHLSNVSVTEDQFVTRGDIIGYSGATPGTNGAGPFTTGPHLHLEVRKNGIPVNPLDYLVKDY